MSAGTNGSYVLVAMTYGDGEVDVGRRIWSQEFRTRRAAEAAMIELKKWDADIHITIFDDFEDD